VGVTDPRELDDQLYKSFASVGAVTQPKEGVRAESAEHLKQFLTEDHRYVFSGLIVDYMGVFRNLQKALAVYAGGGAGGRTTVQETQALIEMLKKAITKTTEFYKELGVSVDGLLQTKSLERVGGHGACRGGRGTCHSGGRYRLSALSAFPYGLLCTIRGPWRRHFLRG
jgi:type I site-specific restriction-modification system R (restriction) subunit